MSMGEISTHGQQSLRWTNTYNFAVEYGELHALEVRLPLPELHQYVI